MNVQRPYCLLLLTSAFALVTLAMGQTAAQTLASAAIATPGSAPIPDFSGQWSHPSLPGFEPPRAGPGPVTNRVRLRNGVSNWNRLVGDYTNPILKPRAAEIVRKHGEISLTGVAYPTPANQCWPGGVLYILFSFGLQLLQQPDKVTILYSHDHDFRQVRLNQPHPEHVTPSWFGDSVGHYEGDTLVVDTVGVKIGPYAMLDSFGTPYTEALHLVERYRLIDYEAAKDGLERDAKENLRVQPELIDRAYRGKHLQLEFTVEDDGVFTMPWSATVTYGRAAAEWEEDACAENIREYYNNKDSDVPRADRPDF